MLNYTNRHGDIFTFTKQEDGNVLWEGSFEYVRSGDDFIDPSGGPYLSVGMDMVKVFGYDAKTLIIEKFESVEEGYIIHIKNKEK